MKLRYLDKRPIFHTNLKFYQGGVALPSESNIIKVTEGEAQNLLRLKNGSQPCYEIVEEEKPKKKEVEEIIQDIQEDEKWV